MPRRGDCQERHPPRDLGVVTRTTLYINRDVDLDWLIALEFGRVLDGQPEDRISPVSSSFAFVLDAPAGEVIGFAVGQLTAFDPEDHPVLWEEPLLFDAPLFGLRDVPAGAIVLAAKAHLLLESTTNRLLFDAAMAATGQQAVDLWRQCLECGDSMAHYALGYTLLELGRHREAYGHLRAYTELCPWNAWAWCFLGKACVELGERSAARDAYRRAVELDADQTDAPELLKGLHDDA